MTWVKLPCDEAAAFAALSLRARGLHATLWRHQRDGVLDAAAHDLTGLAREVARRLGATAGDRRWLAYELAALERAGYLVRQGEQWVLVSSDERPSTTRTERERDVNPTRVGREPNTNATRTEHEPNTKTGASARNHSSEQPPLSDSLSEREDKKRGGARPPAPAHEGARTREGLAAAQPANDGRPWWLDPWAVVERLRERSQGRLSLTLNGHERELSRSLATIAAQRPQLAAELDHWAALVGRGEASWWQGAWTIGALLGRPDETGKRSADGLIRCLEETSLRMPKARPAPLRVVANVEPKRELMSPERAAQVLAEERAKAEARRAAQAQAQHDALLAREAANG